MFRTPLFHQPTSMNTDTRLAPDAVQKEDAKYTQGERGRAACSGGGEHNRDARQQVWVVAQVSSQRESGRVVGRQARQERVESAGPGERELDGNLGSARDPL
ncbi:hypothetical protein Pcinc_001131 [Petrolisthes cinctipes]|uniref:Uncharacterized protein n=1 Tax=Petrolisthes cinctipes TaxID=88211 RepID=A0AAE1L3L7_PETCI|nr:hypothetical protein Pcinc_001131 [Petrolisthes cinctipes]